MILAVLDTNIFISALLKRNGVCGLILQAWENQEFSLLYSEELILELKDVVQYIRLRLRLVDNEIGALIRLCGSRVFNNRNLISSTDPKDDFLIAIAQNGQADYLISRDVQGILELSLEKIQVVTSETFLRILKKVHF
jgi:uncharacterized protein